MSSRPPLDGIAIAALVTLGVSLLPRAGCTYMGASTIHEVTCGGAEPPSGQRLATVVVGVLVYLALAVPAVVMVRKRRQDLYPFAFILALLALCTPVLDFGFLVFTIGMC